MEEQPEKGIELGEVQKMGRHLESFAGPPAWATWAWVLTATVSSSWLHILWKLLFSRPEFSLELQTCISTIIHHSTSRLESWAPSSFFPSQSHPHLRSRHLHHSSEAKNLQVILDALLSLISHTRDLSAKAISTIFKLYPKCAHFPITPTRHHQHFSVLQQHPPTSASRFRPGPSILSSIRQPEHSSIHVQSCHPILDSKSPVVSHLAPRKSPVLMRT